MPHAKKKCGAQFAALVALSAIVLTTFTVAPSQAAFAVTSTSGAISDLTAGCTPAVIMAFRGSGEHPDAVDSLNDPFDHIQDTDGWEGKTLHRALRAYESAVGGTVASSVPVIDVGSELDPDTKVTGYPSKALNTEFALFTPVLLNSAARGTDEAAARMYAIQAAQGADCAPTRFVLLGYSQGAVVARSLSQVFPVEVAGTVLIGDPFQAPDAQGNQGDGAGGEGAIRVQNAFNKAGMDSYYDDSRHQTSLCHEKDPVCNFNLFQMLTDSASGHEDYVTGQSEIVSKGQELANLVTGLLGDPAVATAAAPLDLRFILNLYTGRSMGNWERLYLVQSMDALREHLEASPDTRVSVKVLGWGELEPTSNIDEIVDYITTIPDTYNEYPRNYQEWDVEDSISNPAYSRPGADQVIIGARQTFELNESMQSVAAGLIADKLAMPRPSVINSMGQMITGGSVRIYNAFGATDPNDPYYSPMGETSPFEDIYASAFNRTRAVLGFSPVILEGQAVTLNSTSSTGAGDLDSKFEIDQPGGGAENKRTANGTMIAPAAGEAVLRLTVTDGNGGVDTVEAHVTVLSVEDLKFVTSPANGAPASDAVLEGDVNSGTGTVAATLPSGGEAVITIVSSLQQSEDPFDDVSRVVVARFAPELSAGRRTQSLLMPSNLSSGNYSLLVRESTGKMSAIPVTIH